MVVQLQILNRVLQDKNFDLLSHNNIDETYFDKYKDEYNFIKDHVEKYNEVPDTVTFVEKFRDFDIIQVDESDKYLIDELAQERDRDTLIKTYNGVRDALNANDIEKAKGIYINGIDDLVKAATVKPIDITKDTSRFDSYLDRCDNKSKYYVTTGFKELDGIIGGWDKKEEVATIVARPNVGKSWILLRVALAAVEEGMNVGLYSGEMSVDKVGFRFDTLGSHISNFDILRGDISVSNEYRTYIENLPKKYPGSLKILTPDMVDGHVGVNTLRSFVEKENLDMLCIDQYSLLDDDRHGKTTSDKTANISKDLKKLQVTKHIPIISVSQQNRDSTTESGVSLSNVAQSDRIGQDSSTVIFLESKDNILKMSLVKARDSVNGKVLNYAINLNKGIFEFLPDDEDEPKPVIKDSYTSEGDSPF